MKKTAKMLPLEGIRVIEVSNAWAGPVATRVMADMGAEVVKCENPQRPDFSRGWPPFAEGQRGVNQSGYFAIYNRGKKGVALNLKNPDDLATLKRLVKISDILIENNAPGVMDKLGVGYAELVKIKPDIIMISLSGFGATGPDSIALAFGPILEPYAGLSSFFGYPGDTPFLCGMAVSDHVAATMAAFAALAALHNRNKTGKGQFVDLSEVETMLACMPEAIMEFTMNRRQLPPQGNHDEIMAPHRVYRCQGEDKWVAIAIDSDAAWQSLCKIMKQSELACDERFADGYLRWKNQDALDKIVSQWAAAQNHLELMPIMQKAGIIASPVYCGEEIYRDPQLRKRGFFAEINHPVTGKRELPGVLARLSDTPGVVSHADPLLGEHNDWLKALLDK
ncbi:MAG: CoA transferase [Dehalococcoidales bacterium]|nr:CoA transferase [Dehalococcoidales bacterium]